MNGEQKLGCRMTAGRYATTSRSVGSHCRLGVICVSLAL